MLEFINLKDYKCDLQPFVSFGYSCLLLSLYAKKGQVMSKDEIKVGKVYWVLRRTKWIPVKITAYFPDGLSNGINVRTNKVVHVKSCCIDAEVSDGVL